jgi:lipid-A-disaccharide synthase
LKYYIIAGEASGDLHASNLMKAIKQKDTRAEFRFWGGDLMQAQGGELVKHYHDLAFMGFVEVLLNLKTILGNISFCKKDIESWNPDVLVLVDYPGFNLRIAKFAHAKGIKVAYYISPKVWAWKKGRVKTIKKVVDKMLVIFPFEKAFYANYDMEVEFVGNPLLDALQDEQHQSKATFYRQFDLPDKPLIALLPGSRKQEVSRMLSVMLQVVPLFKNYQFVIAGVPSLGMAFYTKFLDGDSVKVIFQQTHQIVHHAEAALVTSGTATLETALIDTPQVVCYKANVLSYQIAKRVIKVKYISLVNLIMDKPVVKELIQNDLNVQKLSSELNKLLNDNAYRNKQLSDYKQLRQLLGNSGASAKAAEAIYKLIRENKD